VEDDACAAAGPVEKSGNGCVRGSARVKQADDVLKQAAEPGVMELLAAGLSR